MSHNFVLFNLSQQKKLIPNVEQTDIIRRKIIHVNNESRINPATRQGNKLNTDDQYYVRIIAVSKFEERVVCHPASIFGMEKTEHAFTRNQR